jgi:hypothetical protein
MNTEQMLDNFRELHERARSGRISLEYRAISESFLQSVTDAQNSALAPRQKRRETPRVQRALQVDLAWATGRVRTTTFDVGLGGFSALLSTNPDQESPIRFSIRLPRGQYATGTARIVGSRTRNRAMRMSFTFKDLEDGGALRTYLIDELLGEFCPATRRAAVSESWFVELAGRALVAAQL